MIIYDPRDFIKIIFSFKKSDTLRRLLPLIIGVIIYSLALAYIEMEYVQVSKYPWLKNIPTLHSLLGFAISILVVFRTNTAYDRWWEGRKLWGNLVNVSRNLAMKVNAYLPEQDQVNRQFYRNIIVSYAQALRAHLLSAETKYMLDEKAHPELSQLDLNKHVPNQLAGLMIKKTNELYRNNTLDSEHFKAIATDLNVFTDVCGACERIKNTPIPYSYSAFIRKFIFVYIATLPIGYVFTLGYVVAPIVAIVFYVLASMEMVAEEIEDPFGTDHNDLPLDKMIDNISKHVGEIIE